MPAKPATPSVAHILPGRHQPPHLDHFEIIRLSLRCFEGPLFVGLIVHPSPQSLSQLPPDSEFEAEARLQNSPERAPFSFAQRLRMMEAGCEELLSTEDRKRLKFIPLPRPEAHWPIIQATFVGPRVWIVPQAGEAFDEYKATFFEAQGDRVLRVALACKTNGWLVRRLIQTGDPLTAHVPNSVAQLIKETI